MPVKTEDIVVADAAEREICNLMIRGIGQARAASGVMRQRVMADRA